MATKDLSKVHHLISDLFKWPDSKEEWKQYALTGEQVEQQGFFGSLGMEDKFKKAGLNMGSITKGLLGIAGPMILSSILRRRSGNMAAAGFNPFSRQTMGMGGGLGSIISMLSGGRNNGTGGLLRRSLGF